MAIERMTGVSCRESVKAEFDAFQIDLMAATKRRWSASETLTEIIRLARVGQKVEANA